MRFKWLRGSFTRVDCETAVEPLSRDLADQISLNCIQFILSVLLLINAQESKFVNFLANTALVLHSKLKENNDASDNKDKLIINSKRERRFWHRS